MTESLIGTDVAGRIGEQLPGVVVDQTDTSVLVKSESILDVCRLLNESPGLEFDYLVDLTAVDYLDYFELVYRLVSVKHNHGLVVKARCFERERPSVPSVTCIWRGADLQEREVFDLMGIRFDGHPDMKRIFLWEGFEGHPLRRDFL
jgi:NADH-quinone oxidoreductase subunit C